MDCTLFIPHLLPPHELGDALWRTVDAPLLKSMLSRAAMTINAAVDAEAWLCSAFGIVRQQDWPLAPLLAQSDNLYPGRSYWLNATPVHLEARRNALVLSSPDTLEISKAEAETFAAMLGHHFLLENIDVHAPHADRWFLRSDTTPAMTTSSLGNVIGRDVRPFLPQGADSARWHRVLTEIQMLLHAHPLNDTREARGRLPVNSVWLWGGGTLPAITSAPSPFSTVWSDDSIVRALAHHSRCRVEAAPLRLNPALLTGTSHFFSLESLESHLRRGDVQAWSTAVTALERDWFSPLRDTLQAGAINSVTVISSDDASLRQFRAGRSDNLKFWRKNKYL